MQVNVWQVPRLGGRLSPAAARWQRLANNRARATCANAMCGFPGGRVRRLHMTGVANYFWSSRWPLAPHEPRTCLGRLVQMPWWLRVSDGHDMRHTRFLV